MNPKIVSTLVYLMSLVDEDPTVASITVNVHPGQANVILETRDDSKIKILYAEDYDTNPIKDMLNHVNEEMCTDCLVFDESFKDPYFKSLTRAYTDSLIHEFGIDVAIPVELGMAIVKHDLTEYSVECYLAKEHDNYQYRLTKDNMKETEERIAAGYSAETWLFVEKGEEDVPVPDSD